MKKVILPLLSMLFLFACKSSKDIRGNEYTVTVPLGGNTWTTGHQVLTKAGVSRWHDNEVFDTYFRTNKGGKISLKIRAKTKGESILSASIGDKTKKIKISGEAWQWYPVGSWDIKDSGYVKVSLSGISKTGPVFAEVSDYEIGGSAINDKTAFVKEDEGNFFYWGRRGPSVHLSYPFGDTLDAEWFYNEITVPEGQDVIGSYYMANGFGEGYFGIQVNSETERRILFSVWSPYQTDDPKSIPADMRIEMLRKGEGVYTGEFGNEGSGGQSFLRYNWKAGNTYKFLLNGYPDGEGNTIYSAYFYAPESAEWKLIASFKRPKTNTYLKRFHSFLENFSPDQGDKDRRVLFDNQWIRDKEGKWHELNNAVFTYDNTAAKGYRMDYAGGVEDNRFYLRNCGFFQKYTPYGTKFSRAKTGRQPELPALAK